MAVPSDADTAPHARTPGVVHAARLSLIALAALAAPAPACADIWSIVASGSIGSNYETNPRRDPVTPRDNLEVINTHSIANLFEGPRYNAAVNLSGTLVQSRDRTVSGNSRRLGIDTLGAQEYERSTLSGDASLSQREFQNSEFDDDQLLATVDGSQVDAADTVTTATLGLRYDEALSERMNGSVFYDGRRVEFSADGRDDFLDNRVGVGLDYDWSERLRLTSNASFQNFRPEIADDRNVVRLSAGATYELSETSRIELVPGIVWQEDATGFSLRASYRQEFELSVLDLTASRDVEPNDAGALRETTRLGAAVTRDLSERTVLSFAADWAETEDDTTREVVRLTSGVTHLLSEFVTTGVSLSWRQSTVNGTDAVETRSREININPFLNWTITEEISAQFRYNEIRVEQAPADTVARSRRASVSLSYNLPLK